MFMAEMVIYIMLLQPLTLFPYLCPSFYTNSYAFFIFPSATGIHTSTG